MRRQRPQNYKPPAIRLPVLLFFAVVLATCTALIEYILHKAVTPAESDFRVQTRSEPLSEIPPAPIPVMFKRRTTGTCSLLPTHTSALTSLHSKASSLCSEFSRTFPTSTRLNSAQVTLFEQWSASFFPISSAMSSENEQASDAYSDCSIHNMTTYAPFSTLMNQKSRLVFGGCGSTSYPRDCWATGTIYINSSTVHNEMSAACAAVTSLMATITSQSRTLPSTPAPAPAAQGSITSNAPTLATGPAAQASITSQRPSSATGPEAQASITSQRPSSATGPAAQASITSQRPTTTEPVAASSATLSSMAIISSQRSSSSQLPTITLLPSSSAMAVISSQRLTAPGATPPAGQASITSQRSYTPQSTSSIPMTPSITSSMVSATPLTSFIGVQSISSSNSLKAISSSGYSSSFTSRPSTTILSTSTLTTSATSTTVETPGATFAASEVIVNRTFDNVSYIAAIYIPTILAIFIKIIWEIIYSSFKMMEPFNQLTKSGGVLAKKSLFAQYLSNTLAWASVKAALTGAALPLLTTSIYGLVTLITILAASSMTVRTTASCQITPTLNMRCDMAWIINLIFMRLVEAFLVISLVLILVIIVITRRYKTGVACNPTSIASVAALVNHDALTHDFRMIPGMATESELVAALQHRQCQIRYHGHDKGDQRYGICSTVNAGISGFPQQSQPGGTLQRWFGGYSAVSNPAGAKASSSLFSKRFEDTLLDVLQFLSSLALFVTVTAYRFDYNKDFFNDFFNSGSMQARLVIIVAAAVVDIQWKRFDREVRITEPYRRMAKGFARPETTVLQNLNGTCWSWLLSSLDQAVKFPGMWFQTLVSFVAILSDFNIIAVASVVWRDGQLPLQFLVSSYMAMTITMIMVLVMLITMLWWRKGVVSQMPRCPETIGAVYSYLCASRFAVQMAAENLEEVSQEERDDMVIQTGWRFTFQYKTGVDGQDRWLVDFDSPTSDEKMPVVQQEWRAFDFTTPIPAERMPVVQQEWRR